MDASVTPSEHIDVITLLMPLSRGDLEQLGLQMGLHLATLRGYANRTEAEYIGSMVLDWTNKKDSVLERGDSTWRALENHLRELDQNGIAKKVVEMKGDKPPVIHNSPTHVLNVVPGKEATFSVMASGNNLKYQWQKDAVAITGETSSTYTVMKTTANDEGEYRCVVSNDGGNVASDSARLTMLKCPVIDKHPTNVLNIVPETKITLSVSASGISPIYQWQKNGNAIEGATSNTFSIQETRAEHEGEYQCIVSNDAGESTSGVARLTILKPPVIDNSPIDINIVPGKKATLSVTATGYNLKYQWKKGAVAIPGATSSTYSILATTQDDEGEYQCVVSNEAGNVSSHFTRLTVLKHPVIDRHPIDMLNVIPDTEVTLSVLASGVNPIYQWQKDGMDIPGATLKTYLIPKITVADEGEYQCVVSNDAGNVPSNSARLTILKCPVIDKHPTDMTNVVPESKSTLSVSVSGVCPIYQWQKNGEDIPEATSATYTILSTTVDDEGEYQCIVSNDAGNVPSYSARLTVLKPPVIDKHPNDMTNVVPETKTTFLVSLASGVHSVYQWRKDGVNIPGAISDTYSIPKTRVEHEGEYECVVSNDAGRIPSNPARLTILKHPVINQHPHDILNVVPKTRSTLSVLASGSGVLPDYQWQKNGINIVGATFAEFCISNTTVDDEGEYRCIVSNGAGSVPSNIAKLIVLKPPVIDKHPTNVANAIPNTKVLFLVSASGDHPTYQWQKNGKDIPEETSDTYTILKTTMADEGEYQCVVSNDAGKLTSKVASLILLKPPVIVNTSTDINDVAPGKKATLSVTANGHNLKYQWQKDEVDIPGATSSTYTILETTYEDEGEYLCVVSNDAGSVPSNSAGITVLKRPIINSHPSDLTNVVPEKKSKLSVLASGVHIIYQWQKNGKDILGETSLTYSIPNTRVEHEGEYLCVVSNDAGSVPSHSARLTVLKRPVIDKHPTDIIKVIPETKATLSISASGVRLIYKWQKDGTDIPGAIYDTFSIPKTRVSDEGEYGCIVSNGAGSIPSNTARLTVLKCPVIDKHPTNAISVIPEMEATLSVSASGDHPTYQWQKDEKNIPGATSDVYSILNTRAEHEGGYQCVVSNAAGKVTSDVARLSILKPPIINNHPIKMVNVIPGKKATLSVTAIGDNLKYQWKKDTVAIPGATSSTYSILETTYEDEGEYHCVVSNDAGNMSSNSSSFTVLKRPVIVKHPTDKTNVVPETEVSMSILASGASLVYQWQKNRKNIPATSDTYTIPNTKLEHEGEYRCVVSNGAGNVSSNSIRLTILKQPVIDKHPTDIINVIPDTEATLSISASGVSPAYQWKKNGKSIKGATSATYCIPNTRAEHEGEYQCAVSNGGGEVVSDVAELTLLKCPVIHKHPTDVIDIIPETKTTLSVSASGIGLIYQWIKNGEHIPKATSDTYIIPKTTVEHEGEYQCIVSNDAGQFTSDVAKIKLFKSSPHNKEAPVIDKHPTHIMNVKPESEATLSVSASGVDLMYQWRKDEKDIPGATCATYSIPKTTIEHEGEYQCIVSNDAGSVFSNSAQLTVHMLKYSVNDEANEILNPPVIHNSPNDMENIVPGEKIILKVAASGDNLKYQWKKNCSTISGATSSTYSILEATYDDEGEYRCVVSNDAGRVTSNTARLVLLRHPIIDRHPTDMTNIVPEKKATLSVSARGNYLTYQWQKDGRDIPGATSDFYSILNTKLEHEGEYLCVVNNDTGSVPSNSARLTVLKRPVIDKQPIDMMNVVPETKVILTVSAIGVYLNYQWQKNGKNIPEATSDSHSISKTNVQHEGEYQCVVSNDAGDSTSDIARLTILKPPVIDNSPTNIMNIVPGKKATLSVTASGDNKYQWKKDVITISGATSSTYSILEITYDDEGEYQCVVSNDAGSVSSCSARVTVLKRPVIENHPIDLLNVVPETEATLSVSASGVDPLYQWQKDGENIAGATFETFSVPKARIADEGEYQCIVSNGAGNVSSNSARLTVLKCPVIDKHPSDWINVAPGTKAILSVSASGVHPKYQWLKNGENIIGETSDTFSIFKTSVDDEGEYQCIVSNDAGSVPSNSARLTILKPPIINKHPTDIMNVVPDMEAKLSVSAAGVCPIYQWQKNKENIQGATLDTYCIQNARVEHEGEYQCVVQNDAGKVASHVAVLTILKPPVIKISPSDNNNVVPGQKATLSVTASGDSLEYHWKKDGVPIPGATSSFYSILETTYDDEGEYQCNVSNGAGIVSSDPARITVLKRPVINKHPIDLMNVIPETEATLSVLVTGLHLSYQWQKNGKDIPGATSDTYSILNTKTEHEGEYHCVVSNDAGRVPSNSARLSVLKLPIIDKHPTDIMNVIPEEKITLSVSAVGVHPIYQWQKNGENIQGATSDTYCIQNARVEHEGEYQCVVQNDAGKVTSHVARLTILKPPVIKISPSDNYNVVPGQKATLSVTASGDSLEYHWKKDGVPIPGATSSFYLILETTYDDEGEYQCDVSNGGGNVSSDPARITVLKRPVINKHPIDLMNVVPETEATLSVLVTGLHLSYQWQKNGKDIPGATSDTYSILNTKTEHEGEYHCVVSNDAGRVPSNSARLSVLKWPIIDKHPTDIINVVPEKKITLSVSAVGVHLIYQWQKNGENIQGANSDTYCIQNARVEHEGEYQCVVRNDAGEVTSHVAVLTILKPPVIAISPSDNNNVVLGQKATLSVTASGDSLEYHWKKDGVPIPGATSSFYSILETTYDDEGEYQCNVSNGAGVVSSDSARITVLKRPVIDKHPIDLMNVIPGREATFLVLVTGLHLSYQWQKNGKNIPGATSDTYSISETGVEHEGEYQCIVRNDAGNVHSNSATLTVLNEELPTVKKNPWPPALGDKPKLGQLVSFQGKSQRINIVKEINDYSTFGVLLLDDDDGSKVTKLEEQHQHDINRHILQQWIGGEGRKPVTWEVLIDVIADIGLPSELVEAIKEVFT